ncbi:MAG TPA: helix-turn-helix domain-containing protein [Actinomycetota bacterium]|nr:helix-turn-helix domain-containing protein [Actinomycetota bacterium]
MRTYGQYCPIARGAEIFAERWTPLILRNLALGCRTFSELHQGVPTMSRTLLSKRLRSLERQGIVGRERYREGRASYVLTRAGEELAELSFALGTWGARWLQVGPEHTDPLVVLWAWRNAVKPERLPKRRVVIRFDLPSGKHRRFWMLFEDGEGEVCLRPPGGDEDMIVKTDPYTLMLVHMGRLSIPEATARGVWTMEGDPVLVRRFPSWGGLSRYAKVRPVRSSSAGRHSA